MIHESRENIWLFHVSRNILNVVHAKTKFRGSRETARITDKVYGTFLHSRAAFQNPNSIYIFSCFIYFKDYFSQLHYLVHYSQSGFITIVPFVSRYLKNIRALTDGEKASGFTQELACSRALKEAFSSLYL